MWAAIKPEERTTTSSHVPAAMTPSLAERAGTTFTAITQRFQNAITFDPGSKRQLIILHCLLGIQAEETIFKNVVQRFLETDQLFDRIEWSTADSLLESKLGAQFMVYNGCIERVLASVSALAILTHPDYSKVCSQSLDIIGRRSCPSTYIPSYPEPTSHQNG